MLDTPTVVVTCDCNKKYCMQVEEFKLNKIGKTRWSRDNIKEDLEQLGWLVIERDGLVWYISPLCDVPDDLLGH